jgi:hypothetical protein
MNYCFMLDVFGIKFQYRFLSCSNRASQNYRLITVCEQLRVIIEKIRLIMINSYERNCLKTDFLVELVVLLVYEIVKIIEVIFRCQCDDSLLWNLEQRTLCSQTIYGMNLDAGAWINNVFHYRFGE